MKAWAAHLLMAACTLAVVFLLTHTPAADPLKQPNPMKANAAQYERMSGAGSTEMAALAPAAP